MFPWSSYFVRSIYQYLVPYIGDDSGKQALDIFVYKTGPGTGCHPGTFSGLVFHIYIFT